MGLKNSLQTTFLLVVTFDLCAGGRPLSRTYEGDKDFKPRLVVVDVDTGLDDAWGLVLLLAAQRMGLLRILAVTTESGNTNMANVLRNTIRTLQVSRFADIPVYQGVANPIVDCNRTCNYYGCDGFCNVEFNREPDLRQIQLLSAPRALAKLATRYPGEISLICTAPLLNVARAIQHDPKFTSNLREIVIMGAHYPDQSPEFNFEIAPQSANIVLTQAQCPITILTSEACEEADFTIKWGLEAFSNSRNPPIEMLHEVDEAYAIINANSSRWYKDDLFLAAYFLNHEVAQRLVYTCGRVIGDGPEAGTFVPIECERPNLKIITKLDREKLRHEVLKSKQI